MMLSSQPASSGKEEMRRETRTMNHRQKLFGWGFLHGLPLLALLLLILASSSVRVYAEDYRMNANNLLVGREMRTSPPLVRWMLRHQSPRDLWSIIHSLVVFYVFALESLRHMGWGCFALLWAPRCYEEEQNKRGTFVFFFTRSNTSINRCAQL